VNRAEPAVVETHVSVLIFHDDVVLKFKKPVCFPFVDLRSRAARRSACEAEVSANSRLSPDVYLGVADVRLGDELLDHAVVLRRLDGHRSLESIVETRDAGLDDQLRQLARLLADFHARAARSGEIDAGGSPDSIRQVWQGCFAALERYGGEVLDPAKLGRVETLAMRFLEGRGPLLARRVARRHICDGHGDLLAGDVFFLEDGPRVLDCVEFDPRLRHIDVIADIAFLVMDLERLGASVAALRFVGDYEEAAGDPVPRGLLHHYVAQRAVVRTEVACLRLSQGARSESLLQGARALLDQALSHLLEARVVLGVVCGPPGTGKSTLAAAVAERLDWPVLRSDEIRQQLAEPGRTTRPVSSFDTGAYSREMTEQTYGSLLEQARASLRNGRSVLLDATFSDPSFRRRAEQLASETSTDLVALRCVASPAAVESRIRARRLEGSDVSGADEEVARRIAARYEPWPMAFPVDTEGMPLEACVASAIDRLRQD
jgi:uncharacterized protein